MKTIVVGDAVRLPAVKASDEQRAMIFPGEEDTYFFVGEVISIVDGVALCAWMSGGESEHPVTDLSHEEENDEE